MFKWHVHSGLGRGRPLQSDLNKVADGIALSLRQFHISPTSRAEDRRQQSPSNPPSTRSRRLAETTQEIQNLAARLNASSPPIGPRPSSAPRAVVDARSLAVKPDGAPLIRFDSSNFARGGGFRGGSSDGPGSARGEFRGAFRGAFRGGLGLRGRGGGGGLRDRGRGGGGGGRGGRGDREGGRRGGKGRGGALDPLDGEEKFEHTSAEKQYMAQRRSKDGQERVSFVPPELTRESLIRDGPVPAVVVGELGMTEVVQDKLRLLAERPPGTFERTADLARRLVRGEFVLFESDAEKDAVIKLAGKMSEIKAIKLSERKGEVVAPEDVSFVNVREEDRTAFENRWLKGISDDDLNSTVEDLIVGRLTRGSKNPGKQFAEHVGGGVQLHGRIRSRLQAQTSVGSGPGGEAAREDVQTA